MALTVSFDVVTFHPGKIVLAEPETSGQPASGSFRACFHGSLLFRISKSSAVPPRGERTPLACATILISEFGFIAPRVKAGTDFTSAPASLSAQTQLNSNHQSTTETELIPCKIAVTIPSCPSPF
jgi:hypothetical protein